MKCPGTYKYKNTSANRVETFECKKQLKCKHYSFRTAGRVTPISATKECEHFKPMI